MWKAIKRPSEEEIQARKSFAGIHASAVEMYGQTATYTESVQRLVADGWDRTLAETVAGFEHAGAAAGVSHDEVVRLYAQYQQAVKDGNTELVASIEATYQGWIDSAAEAEAETTAAAQRSTNAAVSGFERAKSEGERAYKTIYEAAIEAGATEEEAVAKAGAARDAERAKTLAAEGEKFARLAAFNAALALGTEATEEQRSAAADAAAAAALESWDAALTAVTAADTAAADAMSAETGGPARTKEAIEQALLDKETGALPAVEEAMGATTSTWETEATEIKRLSGVMADGMKGDLAGVRDAAIDRFGEIVDAAHDAADAIEFESIWAGHDEGDG